jgi:hypothetical protein
VYMKMTITKKHDDGLTLFIHNISNRGLLLYCSEILVEFAVLDSIKLDNIFGVLEMSSFTTRFIYIGLPENIKK